MRSKSLIRVILQPLVIAIALAIAVRHAVRIYAIPSASMEPTLQVGDHILVTPYFFGDGRPTRGDVVVFRTPGAADELMVKRVLGTPGDLIESHNGRVMIGRHTLAETYLREPAASGAIAAQIVPADQLFVMGDNRGDSFDSRSWGTLPRNLVVGRARVVLWSSGDGTSAPSAHASTRTDSLATAAGRWHFTRLFHRIQ